MRRLRPVFFLVGPLCTMGCDVVPLPDGPPPDTLYYTLSVDSDVYEEGHVTLRYEVINGDDQPWHFLKWHTPLEGLVADHLDVLRGDEDVPYVGILADRGPPSSASYETVAPGDSVTREVRLTDDYVLQDPGEYTVDHFGWVLDARVGEEVDVRALDAFEQISLERVGPIARFTIAEGANMALPEDSVPSERRGAYQAPPRYSLPLEALPPRFVSCNATQTAVATAAFRGAQAMIAEAAQAMAYDPVIYKSRIDMWFGTEPADPLFTSAEQLFGHMYRNGLQRTVTFDCAPPECAVNEGVSAKAYVIRSVPRIYLCDQFWGLPSTGLTSTVTTVVHELAHLAGVKTPEKVPETYGTKAAADLAEKDTLGAVQNASNFGYFATSVRDCGNEIATVRVADSCQIRTVPLEGTMFTPPTWVVQVTTLGVPDQQLDILNLDAEPCTFDVEDEPQVLLPGERYTLAGAQEHYLENMGECSLFLAVGMPKK